MNKPLRVTASAVAQSACLQRLVVQDHCQKVVKAVGPPDIAGAYVGPRARLLVAYSRAHLGISLGKTTDLLEQWYGLNLSRAGALGHVVWAGKLFDPVVQKLFEILRSEPVIHADETGWRINGKNRSGQESPRAVGEGL